MQPPSKFKDIPVAPGDLLARLAALKPPEPEKEAGRGMARAEKGRQRANETGRNSPASGRWQDLGPMDLGKYLAQYGIPYQVKPGRNGAMLYTLQECIFDPSHGPNEAAIVQAAHGPLYYQCFHDSCQGRTWAQAREKISGQDSLAPFCEGYDPQFKVRKSKKPRAGGNGSGDGGSMVSDLPMVCIPLADVVCETLPPPVEVDPSTFFCYDENRNRAKFDYPKFASYLSHYFHPLCYTNGVFYRYAGGVWSVFPEGELLKAAAMAMGNEFNTSRVNNVMAIIKSLLFRDESAWPEQDINLLNCKNGMLDLTSYELRPHHPDYGSRTQIEAPYDPDATADDFIRVLAEIFPGEEHIVNGMPYQGKIKLVQQMFGYCLWPSCSLETAFFLYGSGANGKGTVCDALGAIIGENNTSSLSLEDMATQFRVSMLQGRLVNYCGENPERKAIQTDVLKRAISGETITVERKYGEPFQFKPYCTFIFTMNMTPTITDKSYGFSRRVVFIKFNQSFKGTDRKPDIKRTIGDNKAGLLNFALAGLADVRQHQGFYKTALIEKEKDEFLGRLNPVLQFGQECLTFVDDPAVYSLSKDVFSAYQKWCTANNHKSMSATKFNEQMEQNFPVQKCLKTKRRLMSWARVMVKLEAMQSDE